MHIKHSLSLLAAVAVALLAHSPRTVCADGTVVQGAPAALSPAGDRQDAASEVPPLPVEVWEQIAHSTKNPKDVAALAQASTLTAEGTAHERTQQAAAFIQWRTKLNAVMSRTGSGAAIYAVLREFPFPASTGTVTLEVKTHEQFDAIERLCEHVNGFQDAAAKEALQVLAHFRLPPHVVVPAFVAQSVAQAKKLRDRHAIQLVTLRVADMWFRSMPAPLKQTRLPLPNDEFVKVDVFEYRTHLRRLPRFWSYASYLRIGMYAHELINWANQEAGESRQELVDELWQLLNFRPAKVSLDCTPLEATPPTKDEIVRALGPEGKAGASWSMLPALPGRGLISLPAVGTWLSIFKLCPLAPVSLSVVNALYLCEPASRCQALLELALSPTRGITEMVMNETAAKLAEHWLTLYSGSTPPRARDPWKAELMAHVAKLKVGEVRRMLKAEELVSLLRILAKAKLGSGTTRT